MKRGIARVRAERVAPLLALGALVLGACDVSSAAVEDARAAREREQLARFPLGEIVLEGKTPGGSRPFTPTLPLLAPVLGRGVCVTLDARPDGHDSPRWGLWTYEYVKTEEKLGPTGKPLTCYGLIEDTSTGLESQGEFADDVPTGLWRFWYPDGKPRAEGSFNEGQLSGDWKFWLPDGQPDAQLSGRYSSGEQGKDTGR